MKYNVILEFEIETSKYNKTPPTVKGVKELVKAMLNNEADLPGFDEMEITINNADY
jgi:hypothetical protein